MTSYLMSRNIVLNGRRTSVRLEQEIWAAMEDICLQEGLSLNQFCAKVESARWVASRTSAIRTTVVAYLRLAAATRRASLPYTKTVGGLAPRPLPGGNGPRRQRGNRDSLVLRQSLERIAKSPAAGPV